MAGRKLLYIISFLLVLQEIASSKLNVPRVLLPIFNDISINFTLEVTEGGCYKWSLSRHDVVQLYPQNIDESVGCSSSVVVSTTSKDPLRNTVIVLAEEIQSEQVLRCDVIVDVINTLNIVTTTRELYIEEAPEAFEVRAYDDQGNEFTTLKGIEFLWTLSYYNQNAGGDNKGENVIRFISFRESPYETPESVEDFDNRGIQGHIVLLEGVRTGSAKVSVQLPHTEYKHLKPVEVPLMVVANLIIDPGDLQVLVGTEVVYKVFQMQHNRLEEIQFPNSQYYLESEDSNVAYIKETVEVIAMSLGKSRIVVRDRNVDDNSNVKMPSATVYVVQPAYMTLTILPFKNWAILAGDHHDIIAEVFTAKDHRIFLGEQVSVTNQIDLKYFTVKERTKNGTWLTGWGVTPGFSTVHAVLESVNSIAVEPRVSARADLYIYPRIVLTPAEIILPWDPITKPKYEIRLKASGGDGNFLWSTTNAGVAVVTQSGIVKTQSEGKVEISAAMARNHHNRKLCKVDIIPPARLEIIEYILEAELGQPIYLQIGLYAQKHGSLGEVPFTQCSEIPFKVAIADGNFYYNDTAYGVPVGTACTTIAIVGQLVGTTEVTVSYTFGDIKLEDSVTVAAYRPLTIINPRKGETVLAVGTSRNIIIAGGPRPWIGRPTEHVQRVITSSDEDKVNVADVTDIHKIPGEADTYVISVLCVELGESIVQLAIQNSPLIPSCQHHASSANLKVICGKPRIVIVKPTAPSVEHTSCPMDLTMSKVAVHNSEPIKLSVIVKDELGRRFDNISSLYIDWKLSPNTLGEVLNIDNAYPVNKSEGGVVVPDSHYQIVQPAGKNGLLDISAQISGYKKYVLKEFDITPEWPQFIDTRDKITDTPTIIAAMTVFLVGDTQVNPDRISIYNHPDNKQFLDVKQGSGFYNIGLSSKDIAIVKYSETSREIEIIPQANGELKITLADLCLPSRPTSVVINVVSVKAIKVEMTDRVEIGRCIKAIVKLYDDADVLLPVPDMSMLDLRFAMEASVANIKLATQEFDKPWSVGEVHFIITGVELGETKITFATGRGPREARSAAMVLQVFSPIKILPKNSTILVSSVIQLTSKGGPQPDSSIEYSAEKANVVQVSSNGIVEGQAFGTTYVTGKAIGVNPSTGQRVIYSEDSVTINVVPLRGIKIGAPLTRFKVGTVVPIWALGIPDQITPLVLGSTVKPIDYDWNLSQQDVAVIYGVFEPVGIFYKKHDQISMRLYGNKPGRITLTLTVIVPAELTDCKQGLYKKFNASLEIEVFEGLALIPPPEYINQEILLAPGTNLQLTTNRDRTCHMAYAIQSDTSPGAVQIKSDKHGILAPIISVSPTGLIQSHSAFGRAVVIITAMEEFGLKQTMSVTVEVKPIHYILLTAVSQMQPSADHIVTMLPRGISLVLKVTYHDNTGEKFTAAISDLKIRTNRLDLSAVRKGIGNETLVANLNKPGDTMLKVWDDGFAKRTVDYVKFHVADLIEPTLDVITDGDVVCYTAPMVTPSGAPGEWKTSNNALEGGQFDGVMVAHRTRERPTIVYYMMNPDLSASTQVQVMPIHKIKFVGDIGSPISNAFAQSTEEVYFILMGYHDTEKTSNLITNGYKQCTPDPSHEITLFPFTCNIEFSESEVESLNIHEIFEVAPSFNFKNGLYSCRLTTLQTPDVNTSLLSHNVTLTVKSGAIIEQIRLTFMPGVHIDTSELYLNDNRHTGTITINGLPQVLAKLTVEPVNNELLEVSPPSSPSKTSKRFDVKLLDVYWRSHAIDLKQIAINIKSDLTKQNIQVPVKTDLKPLYATTTECSPSPQWGSPLMEALWSFRQVFAIIASIIGVFLFTLYAYAQYIQPVIHVNVGSGRSLTMRDNQQRRVSPAGFISMGGSPQRLSPNKSFSPKSSPGSMCSSPYQTSYAPQDTSVYGDPNSSLNFRNRRF